MAITRRSFIRGALAAAGLASIPGPIKNVCTELVPDPIVASAVASNVGMYQSLAFNGIAIIEDEEAPCNGVWGIGMLEAHNNAVGGITDNGIFPSAGSYLYIDEGD